MKHFSHPHILHLATVDEGDEIVCSGCEQYISGYVVSCTNSECSFFLHQSCYSLSKTINHPSHPAHQLTLVTQSPYEIGQYVCDGCGDQGSAFHFHCSTCNFDLDLNCALRRQPVTRGTGLVVTNTAHLSSVSNRRRSAF